MPTWKSLLGMLLISQVLLACAGTAASGSSDALNHSSWVLSALPAQTALTGRQPTLHFTDGTVHGSDGCNRYSASYAATGGKLHVASNLGSTRMACAEPVMRQADAFTSALTRSASFRRDGRQLTLLDADGNPVAMLLEQARELAATSWRVTGYNNGKQAVVSLLAGSELTVSFAAKGRVSGSAGCNDYHASYSTSAQKISIGEAVATRKLCSQPDGVMEQEQRFLQALANAASWRLDGDRLELRTAAGALALSLSAAGGEPATAPAPVAASSLAYRCGDQRVLLTQRGERLQLDAAGRNLALRPVASASGARYVGVSDDRSTFWSKGERATLVVAGQAYPECLLITPAGPFRATGNEPPWSLEVDDRRMLFTTDFGQRQIEFPTPTTEKAPSFTRLAAKNDGHELAATILERPCTDSMSGMPHPNTVTVVADSKTFTGCGGDPAMLLQGAEWVVEDINRTGVIDNSRATFNFAPAARLTGRSFCNDYSGEYRLTGETLTISIATTTTKACPPALMHQEHLFLEVVKAVRRFSLSVDGALVLETDDARRILARRD